ncbi:FecR family protein [Roseateles chitinivorans]|uniref:FecR family protein n=1 Tax=Roseateles chitinivorans TaxID=2917965 RepID=UPI003D668EEE
MNSNYRTPAEGEATGARAVDAMAADWLAARDGEGWNPDRQRALDDWLAQSTTHLVAFLRLESAWTRADRLQALQGSQGSQGVEYESDVPVPSRTFARPAFWTRRVTRWGAGATAALGLALSIGLSEPGGVWPWRAGESHVTAVGERAVVALTDGSSLTLNTDTRLRTEVDARERRVWLDSGEAYFDIAHDARRPFVIHAGAQRVTVIGTRFSLRRDGDRLRVRVVEGRVQVDGQSGASAVLAAADVGEATRASLKLAHETPQAVAGGLAWMQGQLQLDGMTLAQAAAEFNRYNRRTLRIENERAAQTRIDGTFDVNNVDGFARLLRAGFGLKVEERGDEIVIR